MPRGGRRSPQPGRPRGRTQKTLSINLPIELAGLVTLQAERAGLDRSAWVAEACRRELVRRARGRGVD